MSQLIGNMIRNKYQAFNLWRSKTNLRKAAKITRHQIVEKKGYSVLNPAIIKEIKSYAKHNFGELGYWEWLATYTEVRGEFKEGWMPEDYYRTHFIPKKNPRINSNISSFKSFDYTLFKDFTNPPYFSIISNRIIGPDHKLLTINQAKDILQKLNCEVVVKQDSGASAYAVQFLHSRELNIEEYLKLGKNFIFQESLKQSELVNQVYPKSVNTLRIVTYLTDDSILPKHLYSYLRLGAGGSRIDNLLAGGIGLYIDNNGLPSSGLFNKLGMPIGDTHPDTKFCIKNLKFPSFSSAIKLCQENHLKFMYVKLVAWDVYLNEKNEYKLIEWNALSPDVWLNEALVGPLWSLKEM